MAEGSTEKYREKECWLQNNAHTLIKVQIVLFPKKGPDSVI